MHDRAESLDRWTQRCAHLYTLPAVAVRVLELTSDPRADAGKLTRCIEQDPAITAKILRVVNSSLFGLGTRVTHLHQAVALLGTKPLKLLVLGFSLPPDLTENLAADVLSLYWQRALTRAVAAREICQRGTRLAGDEAFTAALLADVGQLALIQQLGDPYVRLVRQTRPHGKDLRTAEEQSLGFNHRRLSARLAHDWKLPETLVDTIAALADETPPAPLDAPHSLVQCTYLADQLAQSLTPPLTESLGDVMSLAARYFQWTPSHFEAFIDDLQAQVNQLAESLSVQLPGGLNCRDVLDEAHRQLVDVATETAAGAVRQQQEAELLEQVRALSALAASRLSSGQVARRPAEAGTFAGVGHAGDAATSSKPRRPHAVGEPALSILPSVSAAATAARDESTAPFSDDPGLLGRLASVVATCRQHRCAVSLLMVSIDRWGDLVFALGPGGAAQQLEALEMACRKLDAAEAFCVQAGEARLAVALPASDRLEAVALGNQLMRLVREANASGRTEWSVSVGVATVALPPPNFSAHELLESAGRCLSAAQMTGGNTLKSIEIY